MDFPKLQGQAEKIVSAVEKGVAVAVHKVANVPSIGSAEILVNTAAAAVENSASMVKSAANTVALSALVVKDIAALVEKGAASLQTHSFKQALQAEQALCKPSSKNF